MSERVNVGASAVVVHDAHILLVQRKGSHGAGTWCTPGGWVDVLTAAKVESPEETAVRETYEETGVTVRSRPSSGRYPLTWPTVDGTHSYDVWVPCKYVRGVPKVMEPKKALSVEWTPLAKLSELPLFPHLRDYVDRYYPWWYPYG